MSEEGRRREESFFNRWSRLKSDARETEIAPPAATAAPAPAHADEAPELPPVDTLTFDSDFRDFLHPKVDEDLRRSALRKLFSDPHFNVMDGLDVYIDDYSITEPIPPEMLAGMKQAQRILRWAEGGDDEEAAPEAEAATAEAEPPDEIPAALAAPSSENTAPDSTALSEPLPEGVAKPL